MQLTTVLIVLITTLTPFTAADCYKKGKDWGVDRNQAAEAAGRFCDTTIAGDFVAKQVKQVCVNGGSGQRKFILAVRNNAVVNRFVSDEECTFRLNNEINACANGGESTIGDFFYRADPEDGFC
jgi:hypothetical protein